MTTLCQSLVQIGVTALAGLNAVRSLTGIDPLRVAAVSSYQSALSSLYALNGSSLQVADVSTVGQAPHLTFTWVRPFGEAGYAHMSGQVNSFWAENLVNICSIHSAAMM
jgi:hypothetical protein